MNSRPFGQKLFDQCVEVTQIIPATWNEGSDDLNDVLEGIAWVEPDNTAVELVGLPQDLHELLSRPNLTREDAIDSLQMYCRSRKIDGFFAVITAPVLEKISEGHWKTVGMYRVQPLFVPTLAEIPGAIEQLLENPLFIRSIRIDGEDANADAA